MSRFEFSIVPLTKQKRGDFDCGNESLNHYIKSLASQHIKQNVSRTYIAIADNEPDKVLGFYSLSSAEIDFVQVDDLLPKRFPPHYPVPVARLGRLAVDNKVAGQGVGGALLINALYRCYKISQEMAIVGVIVDAKDEEAKAFYLKHGFTHLTEQPLTVFILMKTIEKLFD